MHILIAPNAFKNSLSAEDAAEAIQSGLMNSRLACTTQCFPVGDGGDGTGNLIIRHREGKLINAEASDPLGRKIKTTFGLIDNGRTAVIEMANASGLRLLKPHELSPMSATSYGTGELIKLALDHGVKKIIVTMGGSATVDGGAGILRALGIRFLNSRGEPVETAERLAELERCDVSGLDRRLKACEIVILCDVNNKLLGAHGAAAVFGPQKGATADDVKKLEASLSRYRDVVLHERGIDMNTISFSGTAGGAAAGLHAFLNAKLVNGIDEFLDLTGFPGHLKKADLVITGEGSIDEQTLNGKGPFGVAARARNAGIPVIALAGKVPLHPVKELMDYFTALIPISNQPEALEEALAHTKTNLSRTSRMIGDLMFVAGRT